MCYLSKSLNYEKVIHHDHVAGEFYGVAHNSCNLKLPMQTFTPIVSQCLSKYYSYHILKCIQIRSEEKMTVIPCNSETCISFSFFVPVGKTKDDVLLCESEEFHFLEGFRFLLGSLDILVTTLETMDYIQLYEHFPKHFDILQRKGVFPYSSLDSFEKSLNSRCLIMVISGYFHCLVQLMCLRKMFSMLAIFAICLNARIFLVISSCISKLMTFFWLTFLKNTGD